MNKLSKLIDARNFVLIVIVLAVIGVIGFWLPYVNSRRDVDPGPASGTAEVEVSYTKDGFDPANIRVSVGTTVAWKNVSGAPMWVGSDPHPSHTDLRGFDQLRIINKLIPRFIEKAHAHGDAVYEFTFTAPGSWGYHNHVNPKHRGTVTVTEAGRY